MNTYTDSKVRLVSLEMSIGLLQQLVLRDSHSYLHDGHLAVIEGAREESTGQLRTFYKVIFVCLPIIKTKMRVFREMKYF